MELYGHYKKVSFELRKSNDRLIAERQLRHVNYHTFQNALLSLLAPICLTSPLTIPCYVDFLHKQLVGNSNDKPNDSQDFYGLLICCFSLMSMS